MQTFLELFSSSKSFMESHSCSNNGHMVIVSLVDNLSGRGNGFDLIRFPRGTNTRYSDHCKV